MTSEEKEPVPGNPLENKEEKKAADGLNLEKAIPAENPENLGDATATKINDEERLAEIRKELKNAGNKEVISKNPIGDSGNQDVDLDFLAGAASGRQERNRVFPGIRDNDDFLSGLD
jgi:hypothetical protein